MRTLELAECAGVSLRQINFWIHKGWIKARGGRGSGHQREFTDAEVTVVCTAGQLLKLGVVPERAVRYARAMAETGTEAIEIGGWILAKAAAVEESAEAQFVHGQQTS